MEGGGALFGIQEYILKNVSYVLCFQIVTTNLYILIRFMLYFELLNFLCNHFITVSEHKITLNFHKYYAIARIDSSSNIITFYANYFGNHVTLRKDFAQKNCVALHTKIDLNLHLVKRTSRAANSSIFLRRKLIE